MKQVKGNILKNAEWMPCTKTSEMTKELTKPSQSQQKLHQDLWKAGIYGRSGKFFKCKMWSKNPWAMEIKQWAMEPRAMENSNMVWGVIFSLISCFQMGYDWIRPNEAFNLQLPVNDCVLLYSDHEASVRKEFIQHMELLSHRNFGN